VPRLAVTALVACSSSSKPVTTGDDSWKLQLLPDAAIDAGPASETEPPRGDGERVQARTDPARSVPAQKVRCLRLIGCGCDYGCSMGFWEEGDDWKVNFHDTMAVAQIKPQCVGDTCVEVFNRDICQKTCTPAPSLAKCKIVPDNVWRCEPE
jgi:hypothetical protein